MSVHDRLKMDLENIAKELNKHPRDVTQKEHRVYPSRTIGEKEVEAAGGYTLLKLTLFPKYSSSDLSSVYGSKMINTHRTKLEKKYGDFDFLMQEITKEMLKIAETISITLYQPQILRKPHKKHARTLVAHISDTHFGANISKKELGGLNEFNWLIASRRLAYFIEQISLYKQQYRKDTELLLQLNGDIIAGIIHNQEWFVDVLTDQITGSVHLLSTAISYLATQFNKITVVCTSGNHGRVTHKSSSDRALTHKWDSFETIIYQMLEKIIANKYTNVTFNIPKTPYSLVKLQNTWNLFQTHGDTVLNLGNPGKAIDMNSIKNQINNISASPLIPNNEKIDVVTVGHLHIPTIQAMDNGCTVMINGCLSGLDPFANSIGIFSSKPTQVMFESTDKYAVGDLRIIHLSPADNDQKMDKIIPPYKRLMTDDL